MTENQTFRVSLFDKHIEIAWSNYRFLHFPINTGGNEKSTHGNHWPLLVLDKQDNLWRFYNSLRPMRDDAEDKYVKDAKQLVTSANFSDPSSSLCDDNFHRIPLICP